MMINCNICQKEFDENDRPRAYVNCSKTNYRICPDCGKAVISLTTPSAATMSEDESRVYLAGVFRQAIPQIQHYMSGTLKIPGVPDPLPEPAPAAPSGSTASIPTRKPAPVFYEIVTAIPRKYALLVPISAAIFAIFLYATNAMQLMGLSLLMTLAAVVFFALNVYPLMYDMCDKANLPYVRSSSRTKFIILTTVLVLALGGLWSKTIYDTVVSNAYQSRMPRYAQMLNTQPARGASLFVIYDSDTHLYRTDIDLGNRLARNPEDARYIITLGKEKDVVEGYYSTSSYSIGGRNAGKTGTAYRREMKVTLYDRVTGETLHTITLYGSDAPDKVSRKGDAYGSHVSRSDIAEACQRMLRIPE